MRQLITVKSEIVRYQNLDTQTSFNVCAGGEFKRFRKFRDAVLAVVTAFPLDVNTDTRVKLDENDCGSLWQCGIDPTTYRK